MSNPSHIDDMVVLGHDTVRGGSDIDDIVRPTVVIIEPRRLIRECLAQWLESASADHDVAAFSSVEEWDASPVGHSNGDIVVLHCAGRCARQNESLHAALLARLGRKINLILICDNENSDDIIEAINEGVRGYIPTSIGTKVAMEAMRLVGAGGVYVPASSFMLRPSAPPDAAASEPRGMFTPRQSAVLDELQKGKANKIIAYDLNMKESTVKVHIRNIMRKVGATNRTEVAILAYSLSRDAASGYAAMLGGARG